MPARTPIAFPFADFLINPQTSWTRLFNPQLFISYNSADAPIENHVLSRAGSYGRQLGTLLDVVEVLAARLPAGSLTPAERKAVDDLTALRASVEHAKAEFRGEPTTDHDLTRADLDRLLTQLEDLRRSDPEAHHALVGRLRQALTSDADDTGDDSSTGDAGDDGP